MEKRKRIEWIDSAKGIGLILVILGHLHVPYMSVWIYFFHMPLFFFLSGVVYSGRKYTFKQYLDKRIHSLVIPYFTFGMIIWFFYVILNMFVGTGNSLYGSNMEMLKALFIQKHFWTIWFLAALFLTEMLYYVLDEWVGRSRMILNAVSFGLCVWGLIRYRLGLGALPWNLDVVFVAQFFFHTGRLFRENQFWQRMTEVKEKKKAVVRMLGFLCVNIVSGGVGIKIAHESLDMSVGLYGFEPLTLVSAFAGIFFIIILAKLCPFKGIQYLGKNTMVIFSLHSRVVIVLCGYVYASMGLFQGTGVLERMLYAGVTFVVIMGILIPVTEWIKKSRIHVWFGI